MRGMIRLAGVVAAALLSWTPAAHAQGCVLCYTSLAGAGPAAMRAFQLAMLVLLIPALSLFAGVFLFIFLRARAASESSTPNALPTLKTVRFPRFTPRIAKTADGQI
jgi:hypothetical protein